VGREIVWIFRDHNLCIDWLVAGYFTCIDGKANICSAFSTAIAAVSRSDIRLSKSSQAGLHLVGSRGHYKCGWNCPSSVIKTTSIYVSSQYRVEETIQIPISLLSIGQRILNASVWQFASVNPSSPRDPRTKKVLPRHRQPRDSRFGTGALPTLRLTASWISPQRFLQRTLASISQQAAAIRDRFVNNSFSTYCTTVHEDTNPES